jgi:hypothetical protein
MEMITLKDPQRFCEWMVTSQERISFLVDVIFTMCQQHPDTELVLSLDLTDDDVVIVELYGIEPYRFRLSDYCSIRDTLQMYKSSESYCDFIRRYRDWCNQFQAWWSSYSDYMESLERFGLKD